MEVKSVNLTANSMGKSVRSTERRHDVPGPGAYEQKSRLEGPKPVISGRHAQSIQNFVPGPGQYNPDDRARKAATAFKYTMAGRPSSAVRTSGAPGPGSYDLRVNKINKGVRFGKDTRKGLGDTATRAVPGPGAYDARPQTAGGRYNAPKYT